MVSALHPACLIPLRSRAVLGMCMVGSCSIENRKSFCQSPSSIAIILKPKLSLSQWQVFTCFCDCKIRSFLYSSFHPFLQSFVCLLACMFVGWFFSLFILSLIRPFILCLVRSVILPLVCSFILCLVCAFILCLVHSFILPLSSSFSSFVVFVRLLFR